MESLQTEPAPFIASPINVCMEAQFIPASTEVEGAKLALVLEPPSDAVPSSKKNEVYMEPLVLRDQFDG